MINKEKNGQDSMCEYKPLEDWKNDKIEDCCKSEDPTDVPGGDCCYDTWKDELKEVTIEVDQVKEDAKLCKEQLEVIVQRRDKLKIWVDELTEADELSAKICDQLELLMNQTDSISNNTGKAIKAIKLLFCMIRDYYSQLDLIRTKYDELINCIKCLNHPLLEDGKGIVKCLEDYFAKLEAVQKTKENIIKLILKAIYLSNKINENLDEEFGLQQIIGCWENVFNCDEDCKEGSTAQQSKQQKSTVQKADCLDLDADWKPLISLPICNDDYYKCLKTRYEDDVKKAKDISKNLKEKNKKKEKLLACKQSLETAIIEVDPKNRC